MGAEPVSGPPGCVAVETPLFKATRIRVLEMTRHRGIVVIYGNPGLGKTYSTWAAAQAAIDRLGAELVWLMLGPNPTTRQVLVRILQALGIRFQRKREDTVWDMTDAAESLLSERLRVIVIDEAQLLSRDALAMLRYLHDKPRANWVMILVGGVGCIRKIESQPELRDRLGREVHFRPLDQPALLRTMRLWHPLLAGAPEDLLIQVDDAWGRGVFRRWEHFLSAAVDYAAAAGTPEALTPRVADQALAAMVRGDKAAV